MIGPDDFKRLLAISETIHNLSRQVDEIVAMNGPPPTEVEIHLAGSGKFVEAVKSYRNRNGTSLMIAKLAIDNARKP